MKSFAQDRSEVCACMLHAFTRFLLFCLFEARENIPIRQSFRCICRQANDGYGRACVTETKSFRLRSSQQHYRNRADYWMNWMKECAAITRRRSRAMRRYGHAAMPETLARAYALRDLGDPVFGRAESRGGNSGEGACTISTKKPTSVGQLA